MTINNLSIHKSMSPRPGEVARHLPERDRTFLPSITRLGINGQSVDVGLHHFAQRGVHGAMPGQGRHAGEGLADDADAEMSSPVASACVAGMLVAIVDDVQFRWLESGFQRTADALHPGHGSTLRNGRTSTRA